MQLLVIFFGECGKRAFRLVQGWSVSEEMEQPASARKACEWFDLRMAKTAQEMQDLFSKYRLSEALMAVYKLFWDEFSSWYLELVKPAYGSPIDGETYRKTLGYFDVLLKMLHPFMPFITEELWQHIIERREGESIMQETLPAFADLTADDEALLVGMEAVKEVIAGIRTIRAQKSLSPKVALQLQVIGAHTLAAFDAVIEKLANVDSITSVAAKEGICASFMVGTTEYAVPLTGSVDVTEELKKLEADLAYQEGFLASVMKKLGNEKFVNGAPAAVVEGERKKKADAESKIATLKESIAALKG